MVANAKGDKNKVFALEFAENKVNKNLTLVQCGINHVRIWTMNGRNLASKKVPFDKSIGIDTCLSLTNANDYMLIGGAKGKVYCLELSKKQKAVVQCVSFEEKVSSQADKENAIGFLSDLSDLNQICILYFPLNLLARYALSCSFFSAS